MRWRIFFLHPRNSHAYYTRTPIGSPPNASASHFAGQWAALPAAATGGARRPRPRSGGPRLRGNRGPACLLRLDGHAGREGAGMTSPAMQAALRRIELAFANPNGRFVHNAKLALKVGAQDPESRARYGFIAYEIPAALDVDAVIYHVANLLRAERAHGDPRFGRACATPACSRRCCACAGSGAASRSACPKF